MTDTTSDLVALLRSAAVTMRKYKAASIEASDLDRVASRIEALEAALAEAIRALRWQADQPEANQFMAEHARTTIEELTWAVRNRPHD